MYVCVCMCMCVRVCMHMYCIYVRMYVHVLNMWINVYACMYVHVEHVEDIVTAVFQYLEMVRREGPKEWIFQECAVSHMSLKSCIHMCS